MWGRETQYAINILEKEKEREKGEGGEWIAAIVAQTEKVVVAISL